jgi:hypothetical protein
MSAKKTRTAVLASVFATAAIAVPSAGAVPIDGGSSNGLHLPAGINAGLGPSNGSAAPRVVAIHPTLTASSSGFDWGDAGVGAAGMLALLGLGGSAVAITRRSRRQDAMAG